MTAHALRPVTTATPRIRGVALELRARRYGSTLDRQLAAGVPSWRSPLHATRALQLTSPRTRRGLADRLSRLQKRARQPVRTGDGFSLLTAPWVPSLRGCVGQLSDVEALLRGEQPVAAAGIAALQVLLRDGGGPIYVPARLGDLDRALHRIRRALVIDG